MAEPSNPQGNVELPAATVWPLVLAAGLALAGLGLATSALLSVVGLALMVTAVVGWVAELLPGRGHVAVPLAGVERRPVPVKPLPGRVEQLRPGMPGHRFRLPEKVHPISAGIRGGLVGGLLMPIPALTYGITSGHGPWLPINLLAGLLLPRVETQTLAELEQFQWTLFLVACGIHVVISLTIGLLYGVLLPTVPAFPGAQLLAGGLILPAMWTGASYGLMGVLNPALREHVHWPWYVVSQLVFGVAAAIVVVRTERVAVAPIVGRELPPAPREDRA
ncbi:MAG: cytochrome c oxidase subunit 4 [Gemmataceae bacterium]|nr:cytochrome c oxidase subunit 4 [Gemmataceae bacterium]MDW8264954.1 cytochrome c oxidase subunit 4 [Gemmataceae bacterium]